MGKNQKTVNIKLFICIEILLFLRFAFVSNPGIDFVPGIVSSTALFTGISVVIAFAFSKLYSSQITNRKTGFFLNFSLLIVVTAVLCCIRFGIFSGSVVLLTSCIIYSITFGRRKNKVNIPGIIIPAIILAIIVLFYKKLSGAADFRSFAAFQYETYSSYREGIWESSAIFDGRLMDAISKCGLMHGTLSGLKDIYTGTPFSPLNILLSYGWLAFILELAASIGLVICCFEKCRMIEDNAKKQYAYFPAIMLSVITVLSYLCFPKLTAPFGPLGKSIDINMIITGILFGLSA